MSELSSSDAWYELTESTSLEQGDFFPNCQVALPHFASPIKPPAGQELSVIGATLKIYDVVVLSQSCDLEQNKLTHALVCPYESIENLPLIVQRPTLNGKELRNLQENIRAGNQPPFHMLAAQTEAPLNFGVQIVSFRSVFSLPVSYLTHLAATSQPRLRLRSPYKEHLSQAFARFFMRVGLPSNIPPFK